jgi:quinoprotein glucose dehydrogenase
VPQTDQFVINAYGTIGTMFKPPYTTIVKYDLNEPAIKWRVGLGDDPRLAALGITGTGMTQMRNSLVVTAGGLLFAPGGDNKIRAYDTDTGKVVWESSFAGTFRGGPSMYILDGRQYLLVPAAGNQLPAGNQQAPIGKPDGPLGYVAYALPERP